MVAPASTNEVPAELDRGLLALSTRRPVAMLMVVCTVLVFGVISFYQLPRNLMPDISYPTITVRTSYPGGAPIDVEDRVSERLESVLSQVKNLRRISSISRAEISEIILEFTWGTKMGQASLEVREKLDQAVLPDEIEKPTILRYDPTLDPVLQLGFYRSTEGGDLSSDEQTRELIDLRIKAEEILEKELEMVPGVAAVDVRGGFEKELRVDVDEKALPAKDITLEVISTRLAEENQNLASGILYEGEQAFIVRAVNEFQDLEEIRNTVLKRQGGVPVRLRDVANVYFGYKDPEVLTRFNGSPCVRIDIFKEADANIVEVAKRVRDRIYGTESEQKRLRELQRKEREDQLKRVGLAGQEAKPKAKGSDKEKKRRGFFSFGGKGDLGPPKFLTTRLENDEQIVVMSDQSVFIERSLNEVRSTAIFGGLLAVLVLYAFLKNLWFTGIVGLAIPLSIVATFAAMKIFGVSLNIMSLGGLALGVGMVVDNSIVVLESIFRCREQGDSSRLAAVRGGRSVASAVTASTLTTVAVFFPIVFVEGVAGQVFRDQALTVVISLLASLAVSLTFIPTLVSYRFSGFARPRGGWFERPQNPFRVDTLRRRLSTPLVPLRWRWWALPLQLPLVSVLFVVSVAGNVVTAMGWLLLLLVAGVSHGFRLAVGKIGQRASFPLDFALRRFNSFWTEVEEFYPRVIQGALRRRGLVVTLALMCAGGAGFLFTRLGSELIPEVHQGEFTIELALPVGTRIEKTDRVIRDLEKETQALPEVISVATTVGVEKDSAKAGEQGEHSAELLVRVNKERPPAVVEEEVKAAFREVLREHPEISSNRIRNPVLFSFKTPIEVEIKGYELEKLRGVANAVEEAMHEIPSLKDVKSTMRPGYPEIHLKFHRDLLIRHNLDVGVIGNAIRRKIDGEVPTRFPQGDRKVDLRVRLQEKDRASIKDLRTLIVNPGDTNKLPLDYVADVIEGEGPAEIRRIGQVRAAVVSANLAGLDLGRTTEAISQGVRELTMPAGFSVDFGGQQQEMAASRQSLIRALLLAIFLVYVVMAAQFESLVQPFVILFSIPLAGVGIAPVLKALDEPLNVMVFIGMIMLAGIVVNNAIVFIDCINQLRRSGVAKYEAISRAGRLRLRPILMTTLTTVLGLLPLTGVFGLLPGVGPLFTSWLGVGEGLEIRAPLAITVIAGLLSSTLLTLLVIPVVYSFLSKQDR